MIQNVTGAKHIELFSSTNTTTTNTNKINITSIIKINNMIMNINPKKIKHGHRIQYFYFIKNNNRLNTSYLIY